MLTLLGCLIAVALLGYGISDTNHKTDPSFTYSVANYIGILEVVVVMSCKKTRVRILMHVLMVTLKIVLFRVRNATNTDDIVRIVLYEVIFFFYYLYHSYLEKQKFRTINQSITRLKNYQSLVSEDLPLSVLILDGDLKNVIFQNAHFAHTFNHRTMNIDILKKFKTEEEGSALIPQEPRSVYDCLEEIFEKINLGNRGHMSISAYIETNPRNGESPTLTSQTVHKNRFQIIIRKISWNFKPSFAFIFNDLTDKEMVVALTLADQQKENVIATVSHELRTPINGIIGLLNMSLEKCNNPEQLEHLTHCKSVSKLLLYLVNSILDLSQVRQNKLKVVKNNFNLYEMLEEIKALYTFQFEQKGLKFIIEQGPKLPRGVYNDKHRLIEVLINLLSNALKFTFKGYVKLKVSIDGAEPNCLSFSVEDTGIGIKDEDFPKLFHMFGKLEQQDKKINKHGVGLGLTICNQLIKALNFGANNKEMKVKSSYGEGTTFFFSIPYKKEARKEASAHVQYLLTDDTFDFNEYLEPNETPAKDPHFNERVSTLFSPKTLRNPFCEPPQNKRSVLGTSFHEDDSLEKLLPRQFSLTSRDRAVSSEKQVLVVDDNTFNHLAISHLLQRYGIKVYKAMSGQECLDLLMKKGKHINLIFMDIQMPVMDGIETTKRIKELIKSGQLPDIPIAALTATVDEGNRELYLKSGMIEVCEKPLKEKDVGRIVYKYVYKLE